MVNVDELRGLIYKKGLTQSRLAIKMEMAPKTFYDRMKKGVFGTDEIEKMVDLLEIDDPLVLLAIFFARTVTIKDTTSSA